MAESGVDRARRERRAHRRAAWALFAGLPAILVAMTVVGALTLARDERRSGDIRSRYLQATEHAMQEQDWTRAEMLSRKLVQLRPGDPIGRYFIARCAEEIGDLDRAVHLMSQIAPRDEPGFAPAQWWFAQRIVDHSREITKQEALELRDRLRWFLQSADDDGKSRMLLGQTLLTLGETSEAIDEMCQAADADPTLQLTVAKVAARLNQRRAARSQAEKACHWLERQLRVNPENVDRRLRLVDALTMTGQFEQAADLLMTGLKERDDNRLRQRLVQLSVTAFDVLERVPYRSSAVFRRQLDLVNIALAIAPGDSHLLKRLARLSTDDHDLAQQADSLLHARLAQTDPPPNVQMILSNDAILRNKFEIARKHLEDVCQQHPEYPVGLNNLAWSLAHSPEPELLHALELSEQAIALDPRDEFYDTRGHILARLGRFSEAIPDLVKGLKISGDTTQTQLVLAKAYAETGHIEQISYHPATEGDSAVRLREPDMQASAESNASTNAGLEQWPADPITQSSNK